MKGKRQNNGWQIIKSAKNRTITGYENFEEAPMDRQGTVHLSLLLKKSAQFLLQRYRLAANRRKLTTAVIKIAGATVALSDKVSDRLLDRILQEVARA